MNKRTNAMLACALLVAGMATVPGTTAVLNQETCTSKGGGFGDNSVKGCTFSCDANEQVHIKVESADKSLGIPEVGGQAACGGASASCQGKGECHGMSGTSNEPLPTKAPGDGECSGWSNEVFKDRLTIDCWASPLPDIPEAPKCVLTEPMKVCHGLLDGLCAANLPVAVAADVNVRSCLIDGDGANDQPSKAKWIRLILNNLDAQGIACSVNECWEFEPTCIVDDSLARFVCSTQFGLV